MGVDETQLDVFCCKKHSSREMYRFEKLEQQLGDEGSFVVELYHFVIPWEQMLSSAAVLPICFSSTNVRRTCP